MANNKKAARLGPVSLLLVMGGWLAACSEPPPAGVTSQDKLTDTAKINNQSNLRTRTVRIEGAWNIPEVIGTERVDGSAQSVVAGPNFKMDQFGAAMVTWQTTQYPNLSNGMLSQFKTTVIRKNANSNQWLANSPIPNDSLSITTLPKLHVHDDTGIVYAMWREFETEAKFIRRFNPAAVSWETPYALDTNDSPQLIFDKQGDATLIMTDGATELQARRLTNDSGLGMISTLTRSGSNRSFSHIEGYITNDGITKVFWLETQINNGSFGLPELWQADYDPGSGWGEAQQIPFIDELSFDFPLDKLVVLYDTISQTTAITFNVHLPLNFNVPANIYGLDNRSGVWSSPAPIDLSPQNDDNFGADFATNDNGQMVAAWGAVSYDEISNIFFYHVKARQYSAPTGWHPVDTLSDPLSLTVDKNFSLNVPEKGPQVAINNQGVMSIVWSEDTQGTIDIFANHYSPESGWGTQELLVRTGLTREFIQNLDVKIDANGQSLVMWREVIRDEQSATHRMMLSRHTSAGILTPPPPATEPLPTEPNPVEIPALGFSEPMNVWNNAGQNNVNVNVRGPSITTVASSDELYLSLINNHNYNSLSQQYEQGENIILVNGAESTWAPITLPDKAVSAVEPAQLLFASDSTAFLTWLENRDLYLSTSVDGQNWSDPILIDSHVGNQFLFPDAVGNMSLVWQPLNNDSTIHVRRYLSGTGATAGLQTVNSLSFPDRRLITSPISDAQGHISVVWSSTTATPQTITVSTFSDDSQWRTSDHALSLEAQESKTQFQLAHGPANTLLLMATSVGSYQLFASLFNEASGWQAWQNIDQNQGTPDTLMSIPQISENASGQVMVLWIERTLDANGQAVHHLLSNTLDLIDDQPTWSTPQLIATTFHPRLRASPILQLADDGSATVAWIDSSITQQVLRFNQYIPATGWSEPPVDLIRYSDPSSGFMLNLNMTLTNTGKSLITWQQLIRSNRGGEFYIWALEGNF